MTEGKTQGLNILNTAIEFFHILKSERVHKIATISGLIGIGATAVYNLLDSSNPDNEEYLKTRKGAQTEKIQNWCYQFFVGGSLFWTIDIYLMAFFPSKFSDDSTKVYEHILPDLFNWFGSSYYFGNASYYAKEIITKTAGKITEGLLNSTYAKNNGNLDDFINDIKDVLNKPVSN
eukprot:gene11269-4082_t